MEMVVNKKARLEKVLDEVFVGIGPGPWPERLILDEKEYYRFHDFIYITSPLDELSEAQVVKVCDLRNVHATEEHLEPNNMIRRYFNAVKEVCEPSLILEVGPGKSPLYAVRNENFEYILAELDKTAVNYLSDHGYRAIAFDSKSTLSVESGSADLILGLFVFHFSFSQLQINELARAIANDGLLLINVYRRSKSSRKELENMFQRSGFSVKTMTLNDGVGYDHEYWFVSKNLNSKKNLLAFEELKSL